MWSLAWAHVSSNDQTVDWSTWGGSPWILLSLALITFVYARGWSKMQRTRRAPLLSPIYAFAFYMGVAVLFIALVSPVDTMSEMLGWVHMVQHTLIMMVSAPLMALGSPGFIGLWSVPSRWWKQKPGRWVLKMSRYKRPVVIWLLYSLTLWIWHLPVLYESALHVGWVHDIQHLMFFITAFLFWRVLLEPFRQRINAGLGVLYAFVASIHAMALGIFMAFSPRSWYEPYRITAPLYDFSAIQDQQIAGYIMWMPAGATYVIVAATLLIRLIRETEGA